MDLGAYANIENLSELAVNNKIYCPRLRGYRLMAKEEHVELTEEDRRGLAFDVLDELCHSIPFWRENTGCSSYCSKTRAKLKYYGDKDTKEIYWHKIHGWKRKVLKTGIHNYILQHEKQWAMFNKYVGRDDVLYIHARIGGGNWPYYYQDVVNQPWFIEKIDDAYDSTYCDIYARITK